jgi:hypothetical protein
VVKKSLGFLESPIIVIIVFQGRAIGMVIGDLVRLKITLIAPPLGLGPFNWWCGVGFAATCKWTLTPELRPFKTKKIP